MPVFKQTKGVIQAVRELKIHLEKDLQELTEKNLDTLFSLKFVSTEFQLNNLRIDTLAFDPETKAFVIIEFKRDKSFSVVDQGFAYLALMLNNKADFILEYNERMQGNLKRNDVDWSQSRVLFLAHSFTPHQRQAINFKDLPIELWEVRKYENDLISFNPLKALHTAESIKTVTKDETVNKVSREVRNYTVEGHLEKSSDTIKSLFESIRERIFDLDDRFEEKANQGYIAYKIGGKNIISIGIYKSKIQGTFGRTQPTDLNDPEGKAKLRKNSIDYYNQHLTDIEIKTVEDIDYFILLANQVLKRYSNEDLI